MKGAFVAKNATNSAFTNAFDEGRWCDLGSSRDPRPFPLVRRQHRRAHDPGRLRSISAALTALLASEPATVGALCVP
jgi:hypothetical protein